MNKYIISEQSTLMDAIKCINENDKKVAIVLNKKGQLIGIVTDGDTRRALVDGAKFDDFISIFMTKEPLYVKENDSINIQDFMSENSIRHLPIVNEKMELVGLEFFDAFRLKEKKQNHVFLLAGGLGSRLRPITNSIPKPMIKVGNKPILEDIINSFTEQGFERFFLSVNYKAKVIEDYFGDGEKLDCHIEYIREEYSLGTAGAISNISQEIKEPMIVMNGDILTKLSFESLLDFHKKTDASFTTCIRPIEVDIPFGVIESDNYRMKSITEKPSKKYNVSAGIYVMNPEVINMMEKGSPIDMPDLMMNLISQRMNVSVFPIHEYWIDIGRKDDLRKAEIDHQVI